ncbi:MAG: ParB/RepB/Spo0J family partition protein [Gemmatimonadetes bacterium]|nr:ParB/RepB/Spo0J family partition protein [Gemmatimonadota bacterium]
MTEQRRLGRGLEALLGPISKEQAQAQGALREVPLRAIDPNPYQPRRDFDPTALQELADSIAVSGLLQPIVVRPKAAGRFELVAGERRLRAVQMLGWSAVPVVTKEIDDRSMLSLALIENLQRDDLSAIDEARGYDRLVREFDLGQSEVARLVGRDRTTVANTLRLLKLPERVQQQIHSGALSEGHGRALLGLADPKGIAKLAQSAAEQGWSVRELESRVRGTGQPRGKGKTDRQLQPEVRRVEDALRQRLQTDVRVTARRKGRGFISVAYYSNDDLARLLELVLGEPFGG